MPGINKLVMNTSQRLESFFVLLHFALCHRTKIITCQIWLNIYYISNKQWTLLCSDFSL